MNQYNDGSIMVNGIKIHYYRSGGEKPAVVFLHGITENGLAWTRFPAFIEPTYDAVLVDLRGHGLSDKPESGYRAEQMAEDVYWLIKKLNLFQPVLIGHSMGASIATAFGANYPDMIRGLVLEDPPWMEIVRSQEEKTISADKYLEFVSEFKENSLTEIIEKARQIYPNWDEVEYLQWSKGLHMVSLNSAQWILEEQTSWENWVTRINKPGLLMTAEIGQGGLVCQDVATKAQTLWKNLEVVHFPGVGHHIHREQYIKYRDLVYSFLQKVI